MLEALVSHIQKTTTKSTTDRNVGNLIACLLKTYRPTNSAIQRRVANDEVMEVSGSRCSFITCSIKVLSEHWRFTPHRNVTFRKRLLDHIELLKESALHFCIRNISWCIDLRNWNVPNLPSFNKIRRQVHSCFDRLSRAPPYYVVQPDKVKSA